MSKKQFALVAVLSSLLGWGVYFLYFFYLNPAPPSLFKLIIGIFTLLIMIIVLIGYYKKNVI